MIGDMPRRLPLHVHRERNRHGTVVFYFRMGKGKRVRLPAPTDPEFKKAYEAALLGKPVEVARPARGTLQWLWDTYTQECVRWRSYSPATRKQQSLIMARVLKQSGRSSLSTITSKVVQAGIDRRYETPAAAINFLKTMNGLFVWAKKIGHVDQNPCDGAERPRIKSDGFKAWTVEDVSAFRDRHRIGTMPRLAMELMLLIGLRRSDVVIAGRQHMRGNVLSLHTSKTNAKVTVEIPPVLLDMIEATERTGLHFIENNHGKPFVKESFGNWFSARCREAGIGKSAHGLRKLSATLAAEGGAGTHHLMAQYGWRNLATAEIYTRGINRERLGIETSRIVAEQIMAGEIPHLAAGEGLRENKAIKSKAKK